MAIPFAIFGAIFWGLNGAIYGAVVGGLLGAGYRGLFLAMGQIAKGGFGSIDRSIVTMIFGLILVTLAWVILGQVWISMGVIVMIALYTWMRD
jgi:hypothetical protein